MTKSKTEVAEKEYYKDIYFFYEIISSLKNVEEAKLFLKDILTSSELRMLKRRWHIASLLYEGFDIRTVANKTKTSTQTVSKIKRILEEGHGGLSLALDRVKRMAVKERTELLKIRKPRGGSKFVKSWF